MKSIDASPFIKEALFKMFNEVIEEKRKGIVMQVVTSNASAYKATKRMLIKKKKYLLDSINCSLS